MDILLKVKYFLGLLLAAGVAALLVRAEKRQDWVTAQASLVIILLLLALMVWDWWRANHKAPPLSVHADVYYRATNRVLACVAIGFTGLVLNANRVDHWKYGVVARAIGYGALIAGAFFIAGVLLGYLFGLRPTGAPQSPSSSQSSVMVAVTAELVVVEPVVELVAASHQSGGNCGLVDEANSGSRSCRVDPNARPH